MIGPSKKKLKWLRRAITDGHHIVWGATEDFYPDGEAVLEGLAERGVRDLTFHLGYDPPLGTRAGILLDNLAANKPSLWGDKWSYIMLGGAYLALLYALFARVVGLAASEKTQVTRPHPLTRVPPAPRTPVRAVGVL